MSPSSGRRTNNAILVQRALGWQKQVVGKEHSHVVHLAQLRGCVITGNRGVSQYQIQMLCEATEVTANHCGENPGG